MDEHDHVDSIIAQWQRERPDLDVAPMGIIGRISRAARHLADALKIVFDAHGLNAGEFDVLATLRRAGEPHQLTPTALFKSAMLSSGAMTNRLNRLEERGLITRSPDPNDMRGTIVSLSPAGLDLVNTVVTEHVANEHRVLSALTDAESAALARLLRKLLISFEGDDEQS